MILFTETLKSKIEILSSKDLVHITITEFTIKKHHLKEVISPFLNHILKLEVQ